MLRELNTNEMDMVSGGDEVVSTGTIQRQFDWDLFFLSMDGGGGLSHGGLGVFGQFSGGGGGMHEHTLPDGSRCAHDAIAGHAVCEPPYDPFVYDPNVNNNSLDLRIKRWMFNFVSGNMREDTPDSNTPAADTGTRG